MAKVTIANLNTLLDDVVTSNIAVQDAKYAVTNAIVKAEQATTSAQAAAATKTLVDNQLVLIEEFANAINDDVQENNDIKEVILGLEAAIVISESVIELTKDNIAVMLSEVITSKSDIDIKAELVNEWVADFHTKYIGASLEAPNASWDGMELATGMIYYDIAKSTLMIYINTNIWVPIIEAVNMLIATNNLADLLDKPLARTNLGVLSVAEVEANIQADIAAIKGKPLGVAELDANGLVPSAQLPSYVDDVVEVATKAALPVTGESGKIYVVVADETSNDDTSSYRWTGSVYAMVSNTLTAADVKALYESNLNTNAYTDAEQAKVGYITVTQAVDLDTIESDTSLNNTHRTSNGTDHTYIDQDVTTTATPTFAGLVTTGLVDGRDVSVDGLKLDGIEAGATADQTKLEIDALGIDAATVNGLTVETAVPSGAVFTDTVYNPAATETLTNKTIDNILNTVGADHVHYKVRNSTGSTINIRTVVYASSTQPGTDYVLIEPVTDPQTQIAIGIVHTTLLNNGIGLVVNTGIADNVDTSAWVVGTILYPAATGMFTTVKPTSGRYQACAIVLRQHSTQGTLLCEFTNPELLASTTQVGYVQLNDSLTSTSITQALTAAQGKVLQDAKADKATTLAGYGITDAYTKLEVDGLLDGQDAAAEITYSNVTSGLLAINVQTAIDEVEGRLDTAETKLSGIEAGAQVNNVNTTLQGNTFNGVSQLVQLDATGKLPAIDGSLLTNLPSGVTTIDGLSNVVITTNSDNEVLAWDATSSKWVNQTAIEAGLATDTHVHTGVYEPADATILKDADIGSTVQAYDAGLQSIAALTTAADKMVYTTASDTYAVTTLTAAGRALIDDVDATAQRSTLGLGSVDNTSDVNKPVSTAQQAALDAKQPIATAVIKDSVTGAVLMPGGTTLQRPATPQAGWLRYNTDLVAMEMYNSTGWSSVGSGGGIDFTKATDPLITTNPLAVGALWVNSTTGEIFTCTDITSNANRWIGTDGTIIPASITSNLFGRIWNITNDVYKRIGLRSDRFAPATQDEFTTWLSPSATRVNDNDTSTPSDLTIELDTNTNLPFSYIARKVVDNTGVVSAFDHATAPTATQQIMSEIPKCYYIDALIVSDTKEYDLKITSMTPFSIDVINDLGFVSVTSITCFNPTAGISSGTVVGNVITSALHPAFVWTTGAEADFTYVGSFHSVTGRSTFGTGIKPTASITLPVARTQHTAFGTNFAQHDFWNNSLVQLLAYIERGSNYLEQSATKWAGNSSSYDGSQTSYDQDNGKTLALQNRTGTIIGSVTDIGKVIANSYRGIENYHSALWMWIDGVNINGGICYLAKAGSTFVSDIATAPYFASGYTATVSTSWASINKWQAGTFIPHATTGGTTSSKVSDQMVGETGWRVLLFGGSLNNAGISGLSCWNGYYASSNSNWNIASRASFRKFL